jgi:hypothetical protein
MGLMITGIEDELFRQGIFLADRIEDLSMFYRSVLGRMALGDDGNFLGWYMQVFDEVVFGVFGDGDYPGGPADIVSGQTTEVAAFWSGTISRYGEGIEIVYGNHEGHPAHGERQIKMGIVIEVGVFRQASKLGMLSQRQAGRADRNDFHPAVGFFGGNAFTRALNNFLLLRTWGVGKHLPFGIRIHLDQGRKQFLDIDPAATGQGCETQIKSDFYPL